MIKARSLNLGGGTLGDGQKFLEGGLAATALEPLKAFPLSFRDGASHGLAGGLGNGLRKAVGFRVLDIEGHGTSTLPYDFLPFCILAK